MGKKIGKLTIDRVMAAADIVKVVGESVRLRKAGVNMTGLCPFHEDRHTGNFIVTPRGARKHGNQYHCFVCGAHGNAVDFLMAHDRLSYPDAIRYLGRMTCIEVDDVLLDYTPPPPPPPPPPLPLLEIPREWVAGLMKRRYDNNFIRWLYTLPWTRDEQTRLTATLWQYCVCGWKDGRVVFWQIDHEGCVRSGKLMRYGYEGSDGKRNKDEHPGWIYNQSGLRERLMPESHEIIKPLFGSHLLKRYPEAVVNVVESEKTALIMANYFGQSDRQLWLACGGLRFLKIEAIQPLIDQQRTVWLWPDHDAIDQWEQIADVLNYDRMRVNTDFFRTCYIPEEDGPKADVADIAIRLMGGGRKPTIQHTGDWQGTTGGENGVTPATTPDTDEGRPDGVTDSEWTKHLKLMADINGWQLEHGGDEDAPFLDPDELRDPQIREQREKMRQGRRPTMPTAPTADDIRAVGEIVRQHPIVRELLTQLSKT